MNNKKDYYKILNVNIFSNIESIKKSYRELAMKYHPDRNAGNIDAEEKFKDITEAYEILSDEKKRMEYNLQYLANSKYFIGGLAIFGLGLGLILTKNKK
ncbi:DnaJ domain-containing protein [Brachyspira alvinipulli]|uniref:DnaJ domain-containing protein n=1 Tax=Brachyspira alvinipulli TaxID=84379 RepID=UPI003005FE91